MKCPQCGGEGILRTGIAEASTTVCDFCDGAGTLRPKTEAPPDAAIVNVNFEQEGPGVDMVSADDYLALKRENADLRRERDEARFALHYITGQTHLQHIHDTASAALAKLNGGENG